MSTIIARRPPSRDIVPSARSRPKARLNGLIAGARLTVAGWLARSRRRQALREIAERNDFHMLKDIGVSQEEALREADKPFWRR